MIQKKIRVLVIDDSSLVREILSSGLAKDPGIEVVGAAPDAYVARDMIVRLNPDVLTLDVEMPRMDGVEFLRRLMPQHPLPIVMVSSLTQRGKQITLDALEAGAVDFVSKPSTNIVRGLSAMLMELCTKVKIASTASVAHWKSKREALVPKGIVASSKALSESTDKIIAIGASTGGTEAIKRVVSRFPANTPGVVIVQHMPPGFTRMFAERLNDISQMEVKEAETGDRVMTGRILIAPGDKHLTVIRSGGVYKAVCKGEELINGHCPSVDVLFFSVAEYVGANSVGVILTGMGRDGADGLLAMREAGSKNIAQDEATSVVFGMPKEALSKGGCKRLMPIDDIAPEVIKLISQ
jgi:two-component system chemotaxis response regulator CheB